MSFKTQGLGSTAVQYRAALRAELELLKDLAVPTARGLIERLLREAEVCWCCNGSKSYRTGSDYEGYYWHDCGACKGTGKVE